MSTDPRPISVSLVSSPPQPLATLFYIWEQSRHDRPMISVDEIVKLTKMVPDCPQAYYYPKWDNAVHYAEGYGWGKWSGEVISKFQEYYHLTVGKILREDVPVIRHLWFVFALENIPVALREQIVRHAVGAQVGPRVGFDFIPELADSDYWSQSGRCIDMSRFVEDGKYHMPESIAGDPRREATFRATIRHIQDSYEELVGLGVPLEDARELMPFAMTHRMTWVLNLQTIKHVIGKRSCWLFQAGLWEPIITGMVRELKQIEPVFQQLINPPCIKGENEWVGCPFQLTNEERISGRDPLPPCPLYLNHYDKEWLAETEAEDRMMMAGLDKFGKLWGRNPMTGALLEGKKDE